MVISDRIKGLRNEKGWSQRDLAARLGVSLSALFRWEKGTNLPDASDVKKMAEIFEVTSDYLLFDNAPRDGRVDIADPKLMRLFEEASKFDETSRAVVKDLLESYVLKKKLQAELEQA